MRNDVGHTPLTAAVHGGHFEVVKFLVYQPHIRGVNINLRSKDRKTPLMWAMEADHLGIVLLLLYVGRTKLDLWGKDKHQAAACPAMLKHVVREPMQHLLRVGGPEEDSVLAISVPGEGVSKSSWLCTAR